MRIDVAAAAVCTTDAFSPARPRGARGFVFSSRCTRTTAALFQSEKVQQMVAVFGTALSGASGNGEDISREKAVAGCEVHRA